MRGFGVKDGERDTYVAWIEAAHADGQIGEADRDLRLARARGAETRDELQTLTRDLRPVTPRPGTVALRPTAAVRRPGGPVLRGRFAGGVAVGVVAFLVVVGAGVAGVVALFALAVGPTSDETFSQGGTPVMVGEDGAEVVTGQVEDVVRRYETQFGTTEARTLVIRSGQAVAHVPSPDEPSRTEEWTYADGAGWELVRTTDGDDARVVDLAGIGAEALATNVAAAGDVLGRRVADIEVSVADPGDGAQVTIDVRSRRGAAVRLVTTLGGDVVDGPTRS